jgi:hypothetical protein
MALLNLMHYVINNCGVFVFLIEMYAHVTGAFGGCLQSLQKDI